MPEQTQRHNALRKQHEQHGGGFIVTLGDGTRTEVRVYQSLVHFTKTKIEGSRAHREFSQPELIEQACRDCEALGPAWRIRSISTPSSILADLHGRNVAMQTTEARMVPGEYHHLLPEHLVGQTDQATRLRARWAARRRRR